MILSFFVYIIVFIYFSQERKNQ